MSWLDGARYRLYTLFAARRHERDVDEEMQLHLELDAMQEGDRYRARRRFGNMTYYREEMRRLGLRGRLDAIEQDLRYGWRAIMRTPAISATIVVTLALGIGVNVALFSMLDRLLFRQPAGVVDPEGVLRLYQMPRYTPEGRAIVNAAFNYPTFTAMRSAIGDAAAVAGYVHVSGVRVGRGDVAPRVDAIFADADYFKLLGVRPSLGRFFAPDETRPTSPSPVVVLSHRLWRRSFRGDHAILGRTIEIEKQRFTVIGVASPEFSGLTVDATELWLPFGTSLDIGEQPFYMGEYTWAIWPIVRPRALVDSSRIAAAATAGLRRGAADFVETTAAMTAGSLNFARAPFGKNQEISIAIRLGGVAVVVLLIACANVANLLLGRAVTRRREIAVRLALGISRRRLMSLLVGESVLLALLSGVAALVLGVWAGTALRTLLMPDVDWPDGLFDGRLATFAVVIALATGILGGLAPAWRASRADVSSALKTGAREGTLQRSRLRAGLVVVQAALSVVLLVAAGLFVRSLDRVRELDIGYDVERLTYLTIHFDDGPANRPRHIAEMKVQLPIIVQRLSAIAGVERVGITSLAPFRGMSFQPLFLPGGTAFPGLKSGAPTHSAVSPGTLGALGVRLLQGRDFSPEDREGAPRVVIINETMARTAWPHESALGKCVHVEDAKAPCTTVVGVAENARRGEVIEKPTMQYYLPDAQIKWEDPGTTVVIRAGPEHASTVAQAARREIRAALPSVEIGVQRMDEIIGRQMRPWRTGATLFLAFGLLAVLVAAIGVYSTTSYTVGQRTREMGIRRALGAQAAHMLRLVIGAELRVVAIGIMLGIALSLALGRFVESLLYGVTPRDPIVLSGVVVILATIATIACLAPAMRAARVDPAVTLRAE